MNETRPVAGLVQHFLLTLRLNFRSRQALVYGYAVPVLFLLAFGGLFRADTPPLSHEIGQLLTITVLGGACFGLPTALVAERECGVWRRYRLLPVTTASLVGVTLLARIVIVAGAVAMQLGLARWIYGTPWPAHPAQFLGGFLLVTAAFLGLGLLIAALAVDVPAVQALGQCLFLPMIMIGGVGVPLLALPEWAQRLSAFMPGRYAVDVLQRTAERGAAQPAGFAWWALAAIGAAGALAGAKLFRWDSGAWPRGRVWLSVGVALGAWAAVGVTANLTGRVAPDDHSARYTEITDAQIQAIRFDDLPGDNELITRLARPFKPGGKPQRVAAIAATLKTWPPARTGDVTEDVRHLLNVAAVADLGADLQEAEIARAVFDEIALRYPHPQLRRVLAWIALHPDEGSTIATMPDLDLRRSAPPEALVRERTTLYAKKLLGRLLGKIATE